MKKRKVKFIPVKESDMVYSYSRHSRALDNADYDPTRKFKKPLKKKKSLKVRLRRKKLKKLKR